MKVTGIHLRLFKTFIGITIIAGLTACSANTSDNPPPATVVKATNVKKHSSLLTKSYPAVIKASSDVRLAFRVAGPIKTIMVDEGDFVKKNQVLAQIDPRDYELQLKATEARYEEIKAEVKRITSLHEKGKISENDYDKAVSGLKQITAKYNANKNALEDTRLKAPFSGHVSQIFFDSEETVDAGMPVIAMIDSKKYEIVTHLPANDFLNQNKFTGFTCRTVDDPDNSIPLELRNIVSKANLNGLYPAYFNAANPGQEKVLPGMSAEVIIEYKGENNRHYEIPAAAIFEKDEKSNVWIISSDSKTVHSQKVKIVEIKSSGIAIVSGEITEKDTIISAGIHSLKEGQKVEVLNEPAQSNVGGLL